MVSSRRLPLDSAASLLDGARTRVRPGERVLLLGTEQVQAEVLEAAGCQVVQAALEEVVEQAGRLGGIAPDWVVITGTHDAAGLERVLSPVLAAAPAARVLLEVEHAASASQLLGLLVGGALPRGLTLPALESLAAGAGARVVEREVLPSAPTSTGLAPATERALRQLVAQLAPHSTEERWRCVLARGSGSELGVQRTTRALLSVVLDTLHCTEAQLDEALFSLACQEYRPLELIVVGPQAARARPLLERYQLLGGFEFQCVEGDVERGVQRARGQYLALLPADAVVYPSHYLSLIEALREGEAAWAVARPRRATLRPGTEGFVEAKEMLPAGEAPSLEALLTVPSLVHALVIDRDRLGPFQVCGADAPLATLPLRLGALFEPQLAGSISSMETRGLGDQQESMPVPAGLQVLRSLGAQGPGVTGQGGAQAPVGLRHKLLDEVNLQLRHRAPGLHARMKVWARRWLRDAAADRS